MRKGEYEPVWTNKTKTADFKEPVRQREAERLGGKKRKRKGWFGKKEKEEDMRQQLKGSSSLGNG